MNVGSGQQNIAGGDIHYGDTYEVRAEDEPSDELFQGKGPGRVLAVLGSVLALVGFAIWAGVILSGFRMDSATDTTPFDRNIGGIPLMVIGFAMFAGGGVLAGIGTGMSRAARKRDAQQARQPTPRRQR
jgi:hypothetical protein